MLRVVKVGGRVVESPEAREALARRLEALDGPWILVHGGGSEISRWQDRLGLPVVVRDGLRVTTEEGIRVASMVLSGWVNKRLVAALLDRGVPAVGLSGEDGGLLRAELRDGGRLGAVGRVVSVDPAPLRALLGAGLVPVVSPLARGPGGAPLNVNADEAAAALAVAVGASELDLVSDVPGVLRGGEPVERLEAGEAAALRESGAVTGGMAVKVASALEGARGGVTVRIGDAEILSSAEGGTRIPAATGGVT